MCLRLGIETWDVLESFLPIGDRDWRPVSTPSSTTLRRLGRVAATDKAVLVRRHAQPLLKSINDLNLGAVPILTPSAQPIRPAQRMLRIGQRRNLAPPRSLTHIAGASRLNIDDYKALSQHRPTSRQHLSLKLLPSPHRRHRTAPIDRSLVNAHAAVRTSPPPSGPTPPTVEPPPARRESPAALARTPGSQPRSRRPGSRTTRT